MPPSNAAPDVLAKRLGTARKIMLWVGLLTVGMNGLLLAMASKAAELDAESRHLGLDEDDLDDAARRLRLESLAGIGIGALFLGMAAFVRKHPLQTTSGALTVFACSWAGQVAANPAQALQGIFVRTAIVLALGRALFAALAYERSRRQPSTPAGEAGYQLPPGFAAYDSPPAGAEPPNA